MEYFPKKKNIPQPQLAATNKLIRSEIPPVFYKRNQLQISMKTAPNHKISRINLSMRDCNYYLLSLKAADLANFRKIKLELTIFPQLI